MKVILTSHCLLLSVLFLGRKALLRPFHPKWKKKTSRKVWVILKYVWLGGGRGCGIKGELCIRPVPDLFSPAHSELQYKVWKYAAVFLATSVLVNQTVGGNIPGQWIAIAHTSEALRLCLVWVKHVPKSTLPSYSLPHFRSHSQKSACQQLLLLEVKGVAQHGHCPFGASWNIVPRNILGHIYLQSRRKEIPPTNLISREIHSQRQSSDDTI